MPEHRIPLKCVLLLWPVIDRLLRAVHRIRALHTDEGIICLNVRRYKGPTRVLDDGTEVKAGDRIIELHLNNAWFERRRKLKLTASQSPHEFLGCFDRDLRFLAHKVDSGVFGSITAIHASTVLHIAAKRLGFQVGDLPNTLWKKSARFYMLGLMQAYHLRGAGVSGLKAKPWELKEIWLSREALLTKCNREPSSVRSLTEPGLR